MKKDLILFAKIDEPGLTGSTVIASTTTAKALEKIVGGRGEAT